MRTKTGIAVLLLSALCLFQCGMFEDMELFSGKDLGEIGVDVYYDDGGEPKKLYHSVDRGYSFSIVSLPFDLELWTVNNKNELLTINYDSGNNQRHVILRTLQQMLIEVGFFGGGDRVFALTAGPNGEFYLCVNVSGQNRLYTLPPGAPAIQELPSNISSSISNDILRIWAVNFRGTTVLYVSDTNQYLFRSINGGQTFEIIGSFSFLVQDIASLKDEVYFSSNEASNAIYKSSDGINFTAITGSPANSTLHVDRNRIFALTPSRVYFSDDGIRWLEGTVPDGNNNVNIDSDYTGRIYILLSSSSIWVSDDFGNTSYMFSTLPSTASTASKFAVVSYKK